VAIAKTDALGLVHRRLVVRYAVLVTALSTVEPGHMNVREPRPPRLDTESQHCGGVAERHLTGEGADHGPGPEQVAGHRIGGLPDRGQYVGAAPYPGPLAPIDGAADSAMVVPESARVRRREHVVLALGQLLDLVVVHVHNVVVRSAAR
jgi:hypothetical protein